MKVIMLDFDGVLNNWNEKRIQSGNPFSQSNIKPIIKLFRYCQHNNVKIVISSAWNIAGLKDCKECISKSIDKKLVDEVVISCTRYSNDLLNPVRNNEILEWLDNHKEVTNWIAIDDDFDYYEKYRSQVMMIDGSIGFSNKDYDRFIKLMGG